MQVKSTKLEKMFTAWCKSMSGLKIPTKIKNREVRRKMKNGLVYGYESAMPIRILHVDDEPSHLEITRTYLKREAKDDFEIVSVLSAKEALDKLENEYFDVIVSDYKMPEMNGLAFWGAVRRNEKSADIPFVLFTGAGGTKWQKKR